MDNKRIAEKLRSLASELEQAPAPPWACAKCGCPTRCEASVNCDGRLCQPCCTAWWMGGGSRGELTLDAFIAGSKQAASFVRIPTCLACGRMDARLSCLGDRFCAECSREWANAGLDHEAFAHRKRGEYRRQYDDAQASRTAALQSERSLKQQLSELEAERDSLRERLAKVRSAVGGTP